MKMNTWKKLSAMLLAVALLCTTCAMGALAEEAPVTLKVCTIDVESSAGLDLENQYLTKWILENLNVDLEFTVFSSEQWQTQFTLMLTTNELPDLFVGCQNGNRAEINKYGEQGFFLDFSQYLDYMPNFRALSETNPLWAAYQQTESGAIYGLSRIFPSRIGLCTGMTTFVKTSWLENVGMEMPTTLDEFYDVLVAFKEQDANGNGDPNDEIPLSMNISAGYRICWLLMSSFGINNACANELMMADEDGKVYSVPDSENYKEYLRYLRKLYAEGLLDETCFVQSVDEMREKYAADRVGFMSDWTSIQNAVGNPAPSALTEYAYLPGLSSEYTDGNIDFMLGNCGYGNGARTYASAATEYPETIAMLVDYFLSNDAVLLCDYGVEGETFSYVEDAFGNKVPSYTGYWEDKYASQTEYANSLKLDGAFKLVRSDVMNAIIENASDEMLEEMIYNDPNYTYTANAMKEQTLRKADRLITPYPDLVFTEEEGTERSTLMTDIDSYRGMMRAAFITGESDIDAEWDNYVNTLKNMGLERLVEIEQAAYDRFSK